MTGTEFEAEIGQNLSVGKNRKKQRKVVGSGNIVRLISEGNIFGRYEENVKRRILSNFLPSSPSRVAQYSHKVFCGRYCGQEGERFMTASQDCRIRIYNTIRGQFTCQQSIVARDVGWSVLDVAVSHAGDWLVYSSWCDNLHQVSLSSPAAPHQDQPHLELALAPPGLQFCIFSVTFSNDDSEILGGSNDGCLYIFNRHNHQRTARIAAHDNDVNSVCFLDSTTQVLASAADDGLCKVWDRRALREDDPVPVGELAGHVDGLTFVSPKGDGRYLVTNSKDQTIKLWDLRKFSGRAAVEESRRAVDGQSWDYRMPRIPKAVVSSRRKVEGDTSVMTYSGHRVQQTLIRCHFSPLETTGQKYLVTGSADGRVVIYDLLSGEIVKELSAHRACVRDVSWHPSNLDLVSSSWDGSVVRWTCQDFDTVEEDECPHRRKKKKS